MQLISLTKTFCVVRWVDKLWLTAIKRPLTDNDLYAPPTQAGAKLLADQFQRYVYSPPPSLSLSLALSLSLSLFLSLFYFFYQSTST